jgi:predicted nicotinamide N-methyase
MRLTGLITTFFLVIAGGEELDSVWSFVTHLNTFVHGTATDAIGIQLHPVGGNSDDEVVALSIGDDKRILLGRPQGWICPEREDCVGGTLWMGAVVLVEWLTQHTDFKNQRILELGAGLGSVGLSALRLCDGCSLTTTDISSMIPLLAHNMQLNSKRVHVVGGSKGGQDEAEIVVAPLSWDNNTHTLQHTQYDVIVGSEIIYYEPSYIKLVRMLQKYSHANTRIFLSSGDRGDNCLHFLTLAGAHGFEWERLHKATGFEHAPDINIFELTKTNEGVEDSINELFKRDEL